MFDHTLGRSGVCHKPVHVEVALCGPVRWRCRSPFTGGGWVPQRALAHRYTEVGGPKVCPPAASSQ